MQNLQNVGIIFNHIIDSSYCKYANMTLILILVAKIYNFKIKTNEFHLILSLRTRSFKLDQFFLI